MSIKYFVVYAVVDAATEQAIGQGNTVMMNNRSIDSHLDIIEMERTLALDAAKSAKAAAKVLITFIQRMPI